MTFASSAGFSRRDQAAVLQFAVPVEGGQMKSTALVLAGSLALAFSMVQSQAALAGDEEDIAAVNAQWEKAANSGDAAGLTALYTDDAVLLPPASPDGSGQGQYSGLLEGHDRYGRIEHGFGDDRTDRFWQRCFEVGTFTYKAGDTQASGKAIVLWRKGDDGK